jgi:hypothetical protein
MFSLTLDVGCICVWNRGRNESAEESEPWNWREVLLQSKAYTQSNFVGQSPL